MKKINILLIGLLFYCNSVIAQDKQRIMVLTDIENEPDDAMSLVRFLTYSNQWDVEGLVATTSAHQQHEIATWRIREILEAYGEVRDNLMKHEAGYPTLESLLAVVSEGIPDYGMNAVGEGMDSEGSELIIRSVDKEDDRPVWVLVWGGPNCLAQALWKVDTHIALTAGPTSSATRSPPVDSGWCRSLPWPTALGSLSRFLPPSV